MNMNIVMRLQECGQGRESSMRPEARDIFIYTHIYIYIYKCIYIYINTVCGLRVRLDKQKFRIKQLEALLEKQTLEVGAVHIYNYN